MGKIVDMQNNQDKISFNYVKNRKPSLDTTGIKNFYNTLRLAYKPRIETEYCLTKRQKKFARTVRGTTLGIMILASSLTIGGVVSKHISKENNKNENYIETHTLECLSKETVLDNAEQTLIEIILGNNFENTVNIDYITNRNDGHTTLRVISNSDIQFTYTDDLLSKFGNNKDISNLIEQMINVHKHENVSQNNLNKLNEYIEEISNNNYILRNNHLVLDKEQDLERD